MHIKNELVVAGNPDNVGLFGRHRGLLISCLLRYREGSKNHIMLLCIDPGNIESAYCVMGEDYRPMRFGKINNKELIMHIKTLDNVREPLFYIPDKVIIEMVACYGMSVGKEVFDTCVWIGRFVQAVDDNLPSDIEYIYRKDVKLNLCGSMKAKDGNIRQALIDRFGKVGTKKEPGWFYGFKADIWSAYSVGATYLDRITGIQK